MSSYRRPLKIWDFVCSLQCRRFLWARNLVAKAPCSNFPKRGGDGASQRRYLPYGLLFRLSPIFHCHKIKDGGYNNITNTNKVLPPQKNACTAGYFVCEIYYWDLRTLNNAKPYFFSNEMNNKRLTCNVFHYILVSVCRFTVKRLFYSFLFISFKKK